MPRTQSANLTQIFQAYKARLALDIHLNDNSTLKLSRGNLVGKVGYSNWIRSASDLSATTDRAIDRITIACQNVSSDLGFDLASDLRLLDYAVAEYGKQYQSLRNPALVENIDGMFRGVLANAEADEQNFTVEMIVDYESLGSIVASRGLSPRCWWTYKNGTECTSVSDALSCPKTRQACLRRGVEHQHGGWEFFENPSSSPPGSGGDDPIDTGGGTCFTLGTKIWTPAGDIPIGDLPLGKLRDPIELVSFDRLTGEICYDDEIVEVWEHDATGYYTFEFDHGIVNPTPEHPFWLGFNRFRPADRFKLDQWTKHYSDRWANSKLRRIRWNSDMQVKVRNLTARKNHSYFADRFAVSNEKNEDIPF